MTIGELINGINNGREGEKHVYKSINYRDTLPCIFRYLDLPEFRNAYKTYSTLTILFLRVLTIAWIIGWESCLQGRWRIIRDGVSRIKIFGEVVAGIRGGK